MALSVFTGIAGANAMVAQEYAARGVPVFPCKADKTPYVGGGFKSATTDIMQVEKWWRIFPQALIGMPTGDTSGFDVLDLDSKHGDITDMVAELESEHGRFDTLRVRTPSEGVHLYFQHDDRVRIGAGRFRKGVDWRGAGGYVIAPGSRLPDGRAYYVEVDGEPTPWPRTLVDVIAAAQGAQPVLGAVAGGLADLPYSRTTAELVEGTFTEGQWHESVVRIIWSFVQRGFGLDEIVGLAPLFQRAGWSFAETEREVRKAAQGAFLKQQKDPRGAQPALPAEALKALSLEELQSRDPPDWQIGGLLSVGSFGCLFGDSDSFKSFMAVSMGLSVAYGEGWMGKPVKQGSVVYVLGEGQAAFALRVQAWREHHGLTDRTAPFYSVLCPVALTEPKDVAALVDAIKVTGASPDLIIIDTLARNFGAGDPDKTQDMTRFVAGCGAIQREFISSLLVIHHSGKDTSKGARNSSVLRGAVDVEMKTERVGNAVTLENTKQKDAERFEPLALEPVKHVGTDPRTGEEYSSLVMSIAAGLGVSRREDALGPEEKHIISVLADRGTLTGKEVADSVQRDADNTRKRLRKLVREGRVKTSGGSRPLYWLPEQYQGDAE